MKKKILMGLTLAFLLCVGQGVFGARIAFDENTTAYEHPIMFADGTIVIVYAHNNPDFNGYFTIYNAQAQRIFGITSIGRNQTATCGDKLTESSFFVSYRDAGGTGYFAVYDKNGTRRVNLTVLGGMSSFSDCAALDANKLAVISNSSGNGDLYVRDINGTQLGSTTTLADASAGFNRFAMDDLNSVALAIAYREDNNGGIGAYQIRNWLGAIIVPRTVFSAAGADTISLRRISDTSFIISYRESSNGKYTIVIDGIIVKQGTYTTDDAWDTDPHGKGGVVALDLNTFIFTWGQQEGSFIAYNYNTNLCSKTTYTATSPRNINMDKISSTAFIIAYREDSNNDVGVFKRYNSDGTEYVANTAPTLSGVDLNVYYAKSGQTIKITASAPADGESDSLSLYCATTSPASSGNTDFCSDTGNASPYSDVSCVGTGVAGDANHTIYCKLYDGTEYSSEYTDIYASDNTAPSVGVTTLSSFTTYYNGVDTNYITGTGTIIGGTATDSGSGLNTTTCEYSVNNGGAWTAGAWNSNHCEKTSYAITNATSYTGFNTRIVDNVANTGTGTATGAYTGDTLAPASTSISITDTLGYTKDTTPTLTLSATDAGSGNYQMAFSCDNASWSAWQAYGVSFTAFNVETGEGCSAGGGAKTIYAKYRDNLNIESTSVNDSTYLDTTAPTTTLTGCDLTDWNASDQNCQLTCTDGTGSGCATIYWQIDGGGWYSLATDTNVLLTTDGNHSIEFYSVDPLINAEAQKTKWTAIDQTPPTTTDNHVGGWKKTGFSFTLTCNDGTGSGCATTKFRVNGGDWNANTQVWVVTDGNFQIDYNSTDSVGNIETTKSIWVALDTTPPTVSWDGDDNAWKTSNQTLTFTCNDGSGSGCSTTYYRIDTNFLNGVTMGAWASGTSTVIYWDGNLQVDFNAVDVAGNYSVLYSKIVLIDKTKPITSWDGNTVWDNHDQNAHLTCTDLNTMALTSGCASSHFYLDSDASDNNTMGALQNYDYNIFVSSDGNFMFQFYSLDVAGNTGDINTKYIRKDSVVPTVTDFNITGDRVGTGEVAPDLNTLSTDDRSGLSKMLFSCNNSDWSAEQTYAVSYTTFDMIASTGCTAGDGIKTIYFKVKDLAGNYSVVASDDINYDTTAPSIDVNSVTPTIIEPNQIVTIYVDVNDNLTGITSVKYYIQYPLGAQYSWSMTLHDADLNQYSASFSDTSASGDYRIYRFEAIDNSLPANTTTYDVNSLVFNVKSVGTGGASPSGGGGTPSGGLTIFKELTLAFGDLNFYPNAIDNYFIYNCVFPFFCNLELGKIDGNQYYVTSVLSSKPLSTCESGNPRMVCTIGENGKKVNIGMAYSNYQAFSEVVDSRLALTDTNGITNYIPVKVRVLNLGYYIPLRSPWSIPVGLEGLLSSPSLVSLNEDGAIRGVRIWWPIAILCLVIAIVLWVWKKK